MARSSFGGTSNDLVYALTGERLLRAAAAGLSVTFWSAATGGARYTDLLLGATPVDHVDVNGSGILPLFQGPDAITSMWADAGGGRVLISAPGTGVGGSAPVSYHQTTAAAQWTVTHNLGAYPTPVILLDDAPTRPVWTDVEHISSNQLILTFPSPVTGYAHIH